MESQSSQVNAFPLTSLSKEDISMGRGHTQSTTTALHGSQKSQLRAVLRPLEATPGTDSVTNHPWDWWTKEVTSSPLSSRHPKLSLTR